MAAKPICSKCGTNKNVKYKNYQGLWVGYECEDCNCVVAIIREIDEEGETKEYKPYRMV